MKEAIIFSVTRQGAFHAGIPLNAPSFIMNKIRGFVLKTVNLATLGISGGQGVVAIVERLSRECKRKR